MKKRLTVKDLINFHEKSYKIIEEALPKGDYKRNNKEVKKLTKIKNLYFKENLDLAKEVYGYFLKNGSPRARSCAAAYSLRLNILIEEAVKVLEEISNGNYDNMVSFGAEMTLRIWRGEFPGKTL